MKQKSLTRNDLLKLNINIIEYADGSFLVYYLGKHKDKGGELWHKKNPTIYTKRHPNGKDKHYNLYTFYREGKTYSYTGARLIYTWHYGEVPAEMDVDHINNNSLDDRIENLQLLTRLDNILKRLLDNPNCKLNQHEASRKGE